MREDIEDIFSKFRKRKDLSDNLKYAEVNGLFTSFRYGSESFFTTIEEARKNIDILDLDNDDIYLLSSDIGKKDEFDGEVIWLECPQYIEEEPTTAEKALYKGREVSLGKPEKGDVKKFRVFVKNSNGKVVKVNFGLSVDRNALEDPSRRASFTARHKCPEQKDKTSAAYWACRTPKFYAKIFGGSPIKAVWW